MKNKSHLIKAEQILNTIFVIRGQRVILDSELARIADIRSLRKTPK